MNKLIIILFLFLTSITEAGTRRGDVSDQEYLNYGNQHESVVKISGLYGIENGKEVTASGSGVIIDPHWVLTAAHVLHTIKNPYFYINEKKYVINKIIINEEFDVNKAMSSGDIALCHVEEKIELSFYPSLYDKEDELDKTCGICGYGLYGTAQEGATKIDNKKRAGSNKILLVTDSLLICDMSKKNPTKLEFLPAHGDSGGGLFIEGKLAGINSFVSSTDGKPDSNYGDESGHTRIITYKNWIENHIKK